jgi:hypothetical protein
VDATTIFAILSHIIIQYIWPFSTILDEASLTIILLYWQTSKRITKHGSLFMVQKRNVVLETLSAKTSDSYCIYWLVVDNRVDNPFALKTPNFGPLNYHHSLVTKQPCFTHPKNENFVQPQSQQWPTGEYGGTHVSITPTCPPVRSRVQGTAPRPWTPPEIVPSLWSSTLTALLKNVVRC